MPIPLPGAETKPKPWVVLVVFAELLLCMHFTYRAASAVGGPIYKASLPYLYFSADDVARRRIKVSEITRHDVTFSVAPDQRRAGPGFVLLSMGFGFAPFLVVAALFMQCLRLNKAVAQKFGWRGRADPPA